MLDKAVAVILPVTVKVVPLNVRLDSTCGLPLLSNVTTPLLVEPVHAMFRVLSVIKEPPPERPVPAMMETYVPEEPTLPEIPEEPLEPFVPELPAEPLIPLEPEVPAEPLDPEERDEPEEPEVPDVPDAPDEPEPAEIPLTPEVPVEPEVAAVPAEPL